MRRLALALDIVFLSINPLRCLPRVNGSGSYEPEQLGSHQKAADGTWPRKRRTEEDVEELLVQSGFGGGLIVHAGCDDGLLPAPLGDNGSFLVHGLVRDPARLDAVRADMRERGLCGRATAVVWDGRGLPYADRSVNLLLKRRHNAPAPVELRLTVHLAALGAVSKADPLRAHSESPRAGLRALRRNRTRDTLPMQKLHRP